ncbi:Fe2OG dioxygenase domain-containing protein [Bordetella sputigena]|uniref:2OG-Fe(II) oxygenase n=1 Tax=Bordetella sputigena TaxID=1416810 RepID=UPI0039EF796D
MEIMNEAGAAADVDGDVRGGEGGGLALTVDAGFPEPALDGAPQRVDVGDREVRVLLTMRNPRIVLFGDFLSAEECDALIEAARSGLRPSTVVDQETGNDGVLDDVRTSNGMFFRRGETELVARIETRIARLVNWPVERGEDMQILHYREGGQYRPHFDFFPPASPGTQLVLQRGGQRVASVLMYLNEPRGGGGTSFPEIGVTVSPQRGNALFFSYPDAHRDVNTLHAGQPVMSGEKWLATKWLRQGVFT